MIPRELLSGWDLTEKERKELDYIAPHDDKEQWLNESYRFFRYRGNIYDCYEFSRIIPVGSKICHPTEYSGEELQGWDGYMSDSYFSGIVIKYPTDEFDHMDYETIIVGLYTS
jgi:hypothetical protein